MQFEACPFAGGFMSRTMLALGSFVVGACSTLLLVGTQSFGNQASTTPQAPVSPQGRSTLKGGGAAHGNRGVLLNGSEPTFKPFVAFPKFEEFTFEDVTQSLDGLDCTNCVFKDVRFEYAGGAYNLINCAFSGTTRVTLKGAATNTFAILPLLQAITSGHPPEPPKPKTPMLKTATAQSPTTISFTSPYSE
jgi:hypothetical protein